MARIDKYRTRVVKGLIKVNISELGWPCVNMGALI